MESIPWLTLLIAVPSIGALVVWLVPGAVRRYARQVAFVFSLVVLVMAVIMAAGFKTNGGVQFTEKYTWIPRFGINYEVGVGGIGLTMVLLSVLLVPLVLLAAWREQETPSRSANYAALVLWLESFMVAIFAARDVFLFYLVFEAMLIPVYFMIGSFGSGAVRRKAALKFLLYSLAGGLIMLGGVIAIWTQAGKGYSVGDLTGIDWGSSTAERLIFLSFFIAFAVKAPMWPVHTWLPDAAQAAKPGTSVLLVGVLDKVGTFGMLVLCLPMFPNAAKWAAPAIVVLALISIVWGALMAMGQNDLLRLIAYTSVSHFGFIVLGIFAFNATAAVGSSFYMINHGFSTGALFFLAGFLISRRGTQDLTQMGPGLQRTVPMLAGTFMVVGLSAVALPGLSTFVSEFQVLVGSFANSSTRAPAVIAALGVVLAALYILWAYQKIFTGPPREDLEGTRDLNARELWVVGPLIALMLVFGFYPKPAVDVLTPAANQELKLVTVQCEEATQACQAAAALGDLAEQKGGQS
ncbi:MAG: NADH-quinone oxidoreductase subunit M [Micrococcales bacterium]|nr:NADH-quinone oxidoreductase subunit M [Micrococcales bacterium]